MTRDNLAGFLLGIGAGAVFGLLFAPQSGARTQSILNRKARLARKRLEETVNTATETANSLLDQGREEYLRQREGVRRAMEAGTQAYKRAVG